MRKKTLAVLGDVALAALLGAATASAQPRGVPGGGGPGRAMGPPGAMARFLGLTEVQKAQVQEILEKQRPEHEALREKIAKNRDTLQQALESGSADATSLGELVLDGHRLHEQAKALGEASDKAIEGLLTPEQKVRFDALRAVREGGPMGAGWPRRGGRGPFSDGERAPQR